MHYPFVLLKTGLLKIPNSCRKYVKFFIDTSIIPAACILAFWLRFEWVIDAQYAQSLIYFIIQTVLLSTLLFQLFGAYSEMWVYWSFRDLKRLMMIHTGVITLIYFSNALFHFYDLPRSIYVLYWGLAGGLFVTFRMTARILMLTSSEMDHYKKQILILGAGQSGEMLARQILNTPDLGSKIVGFLDDDPRKINRTIHGLRVFGRIDRIQEIVLSKEVDEIVIAIPSASGKEMQRLVKLCEEAHCPFKTVPGIHELVNGEISYRDVRQVNMEDLLGRESYPMDINRIRQLISDKVILVTGAAGSIGSELCRQIQQFSPKMIIAIDKDENRLFYLNNEMKNICPFHPVVMQLQNLGKLRHIFENLRPQIVFHAAAYKHVPCMEWYPDEAILNNFESMIQLSEMAHQYNVEKFVQISTDKAVNPSNLMGVSKRLCELQIKRFTELGRKGFVVVRFGNVIGSQGSVITIFEEQIKKRKPITVTHPEMERYFMSIVEACRLVLEAAALGDGGCTFLLDMGEPIRILELAKHMIRLSGLEPDKDVPIIFSDLRPGEKLTELLSYETEERTQTDNPKIYNMNSQEKLPPDYDIIVSAILQNARKMNTQPMLEAIYKLIPGYQKNIYTPIYSESNIELC